MGDICIAAHATLISMTRNGIPPWGNAKNAMGMQRAMIVWEPLITVPIKNSRPKDIVMEIGNCPIKSGRSPMTPVYDNMPLKSIIRYMLPNNMGSADLTIRSGRSFKLK